MAIHPQYAEAILDGRKKVEFRKRPLATDVRTVLVYATAPIRRIIGQFDVADTVVMTPSALWAELGAVGCIEESAYRDYYNASHSAAGLVVNAPHRYEEPIALAALEPSPAVPQSFAYVPLAVYEQVRLLGQPSASSLNLFGLQHVADTLRLLIRRPPVAAIITLPFLRHRHEDEAKPLPARS